jgi:NADPH:quinone reductase-like Zn-dependent oxidoreductase
MAHQALKAILRLELGVLGQEIGDFGLDGLGQQGAGVPVVYDSVGKDTFSASLDCLAPRGLMVLFGQSSGAVEPINLGILAQKGSLYVTRPTLGTYAAKRADLLAMAQDLFDVVLSGKVKVPVDCRAAGAGHLSSRTRFARVEARRGSPRDDRALSGESGGHGEGRPS